MITRAQKSQVVETVQQKFSKANATFITHYSGMTVDMITKLRNDVRKGGGELKVVKNRLAKLALKGTKYETLGDKLKGPVALVFSYKDAVAIAKAIKDNMSDTNPLKMEVGSLEGALIQAKQIDALSKLPDRMTLLSMLAGTLQAPIRNFACVLAAVPRDFVGVVAAIKTKKEKQN